MIVNAQAGRLPLADGSVDAALCSPPYFGSLRRYEGDQDRDWPAISYPPMPGLPPVEIPAQRVALGHEPDPFAFVAHLLQVFREVRRVLRPHGVLAVNLGDSYSGSRCGPQGSTGRSQKWFTRERSETSAPASIPPKNLLLMPWRFALAMQADGWVLRSRMPGGVEVKEGELGIEPDVLWWKKAAMPESVRDRPTVDFEDVLLFSQGPRYFWDQEAGREGWADKRKGASGDLTGHYQCDASPLSGGRESSTLGTGPGTSGRNMRSVWTVNPNPTNEEHFAAWPVELASRLIRVITSEKGVCPECGAPWVREVERTAGVVPTRKTRASTVPTDAAEKATNNSLARRRAMNGQDCVATSITIGWRPSCRHDADPVPATVLDTFAGLGRTWEAARETGRRFIGTDLGFDYCRMALARNDLAAMERRRNARKPVENFGPLFALYPSSSSSTST